MNILKSKKSIAVMIVLLNTAAVIAGILFADYFHTKFGRTIVACADYDNSPNLASRIYDAVFVYTFFIPVFTGFIALKSRHQFLALLLHSIVSVLWVLILLIENFSR